MTYPQTATYWACSSDDGYGGKSFASPVSLEVKWEEVSEKFLNQAGEEVVSKAKVFVQQDVTVGSYLYWGTSTAASPYDVSGAYEIKAFSKISDFSGTGYERKAML
jgi:hypothetical protein